jgi:hypothetical protein
VAEQKSLAETYLLQDDPDVSKDAVSSEFLSFRLQQS